MHLWNLGNCGHTIVDTIVVWVYVILMKYKLGATPSLREGETMDGAQARETTQGLEHQGLRDTVTEKMLKP